MANKIYFGTLRFVWMKLALGLATVLLSVLWLGICTGLSLLFGSETVLGFMILLWLAGTAGIYWVIMTYFGYLVKAGHVAIVAKAATTGEIPDNQFETAKEMVKKRFATSNVYFVVDRLVSGAVKQLQKGLGMVNSLLGSVPGVGGIVKLLQIFVGIALGYVDECCLGYTFYKEDQNVFKSAADGVVIYFQNWKKLLKNAAILSLLVLVLTGAAWLILSLLFGGLFTLLGWNGVVAALLALFLAIGVKNAFIDSYLMVKMMTEYMEDAPNTVITFDLYSKLCGLSKKFRDLFDKGNQAEAPQTAQQQAL